MSWFSSLSWAWRRCSCCTEMAAVASPRVSATQTRARHRAGPENLAPEIPGPTMTVRPRWLLLLFALLLAGGCSLAPSKPQTGRFVQKELVLDGAVHRYQVFVPSR